MSWRKYAGGLSPGPAAIPNPANPRSLAARLLRTRPARRGWAGAMARESRGPGRAAAGTTPTGSPAPRRSTPPCAPARATSGPCWRAVARHPRQDDASRPATRARSRTPAGSTARTVAAPAWHLRRASFLHSDSVYGVFATVLGLLAWIYLGVEITVYAAEINVVVARRLWPRSMVQPPLTQADRAVLAAQVLQNQRRDDQHVEVSYDDRPAEAAASSTTPRTPDQVAPPAQSRPGGVSDWTTLERLTKHAGRRAGS